MIVEVTLLNTSLRFMWGCRAKGIFFVICVILEDFLSQTPDSPLITLMQFKILLKYPPLRYFRLTFRFNLIVLCRCISKDVHS